MKTPRNIHLWLPQLLGSFTRRREEIRRMFVAVADHFEPLRGNASLANGMERVGRWRGAWPEIAHRYPDSGGRSMQYTFFYPEEEYHPELVQPLAEMTRTGIGDVEVHIHHDGEGEQNFVDRMEGFKHNLRNNHGLLRTASDGRTTFGFIHGNWALDNSRPDRRYCGLNNEITLLRNLGCYADFTMPSAPSPTQGGPVNEIYWAVDDPGRPKSYARNTIAFRRGGPTGDLLMIPGPLALNFTERSRGILPRVEVGELAVHNPVTSTRVDLWAGHAPRLGSDVFVKLFAHGALERNADFLLGEAGLPRVAGLIDTLSQRQGFEFHWCTAWEMAARVRDCADAPAVEGASALSRSFDVSTT